MAKFTQFVGWNKLSPKWRFAVLAAAVLAVLFISSHFYFRFHPDGVYCDTGSSVGSAWVFDKGRVYQQRWDMNLGMMEMDHGHYTRDERYIADEYINNGIGSFSFRASIFGITFDWERGASSDTRFMTRRWVLKAKRWLGVGGNYSMYSHWDLLEEARMNGFRDAHTFPPPHLTTNEVTSRAIEIANNRITVSYNEQWPVFVTNAPAVTSDLMTGTIYHTRFVNGSWLSDFTAIRSSHGVYYATVGLDSYGIPVSVKGNRMTNNQIYMPQSESNN